MYLTEEQAAILLVGRSFLTHLNNKLIQHYLDRLKSASTGQDSILMDTGAKLYFSQEKFAFYISGYRPDECDLISLFDYLNLSAKYFRLLLKKEGFTPERVEKRKLVYQGYEESRLKRVA